MGLEAFLVDFGEAYKCAVSMLRLPIKFHQAKVITFYPIVGGITK